MIQQDSYLTRFAGDGCLYLPPRYEMVGLAWFTGSTKSSAMLTWGGRDAAQTISSAMSSATTDTQWCQVVDIWSVYYNVTHGAGDPGRPCLRRTCRRGTGRRKTRFRPYLNAETAVSITWFFFESRRRTGLDLRNADGGVNDLAHECASEGVHGVLGCTVDASASICLAA